MNESENRAPLFVFTGIVVLSILFFFLLTSGGDKKDEQKSGEVAGNRHETASPSDSLPVGVMPPDGQLSIPVELDLDKNDADQGASRALNPKFPKAPKPIQAFVHDAMAGTLEATFESAENSIPRSERDLISAMFENGQWSVAEPPVELGQFGDQFRWKLPLRDASSQESSSAVYLDLTRATQGRDWRLSDIRIPPALMPSAIAVLKAQGKSVDTATLRTDFDALMTAENFLIAVAGSDYDSAIATADLEKVSREKIAGLFIIFEEGQYHLREQKSLMATVATSEAAWIIGRIESSTGLPASDFGIELARSSISGWKITGLHFSELLATFATSSNPEDVPYTPIVKNPSGGESLVLYFGYDEDMLHLRAQRQLLIVATLLKNDVTKRLRITGHADALGTDVYNLALSGRRAFSVRDHLVDLGVPADQIITKGFGESAPLAPNIRADGSDNPEGRSQNRRTEIFLDF